MLVDKQPYRPTVKFFKYDDVIQDLGIYVYSFSDNPIYGMFIRLHPYEEIFTIGKFDPDTNTLDGFGIEQNVVDGNYNEPIVLQGNFRRGKLISGIFYDSYFFLNDYTENYSHKIYVDRTELSLPHKRLRFLYEKRSNLQTIRLQ